MAQTNTEKLAALQAELVTVKAAISRAITGGQSAAVGDKSLTRARLDLLISERNQLERDIQRLERGGRGMPIDMSCTPYADNAQAVSPPGGENA